MKKIGFLIAFLTITGIASAQSDYSGGIGLRVSPGSEYDLIAAHYKTFINDNSAITVELGYGTDSYARVIIGNAYNNYKANIFSFNAAYQLHFNIGDIDGFKWFVGGGATLLNSSSDYDPYKGFGAGLFANGGVDYKFNNIPLSVSADYRPTFLFTKPDNLSTTNASQFGLTARYTF